MSLTRIIAVICGIILLTVALQSLSPSDVMPPAPEPIEEEACIGEPIKVEYAFGGGFMEPHACLPQCQDGKRRYISYTNGKATQCEPLPGCNDWGEDNGITCKPPLLSPAS